MSGQGDGGGFLSRWSRLKRETEKPADKDTAPQASTEKPATEEPGIEEPFDPEKLAIPLPSLNDLKPGDSLVAFMQKGVPEFLKNAALRKMWALDPMVRDFRSEALDYAWDWNTPGGVPGAGPLGPSDKVEEMIEAMFRPQTKEVEEPQAVVQTEIPTTIEQSDATAPPEDSQPERIQLSEVEAENPIETEPSEDRPRRRHGGAMPQV
jgi:hypothetical protein